MDSSEKHTQMFMYLVGSFEMSAMMAMGKIKNPMTNKIEKDMMQAQFSIDILDMLAEKTKGNVSDYEQKFLQNTLGQLKLNFMDESNKKSTDTAEPDAGKEQNDSDTKTQSEEKTE